jgi:hypothetical protein
MEELKVGSSLAGGAAGDEGIFWNERGQLRMFERLQRRQVERAGQKLVAHGPEEALHFPFCFHFLLAKPDVLRQ